MCCCCPLSSEIDAVKHAPVGGEICDDGIEQIRLLNNKACCTYATKSIQTPRMIVNSQQIHIDELKKKAESNYINITHMTTKLCLL